MELYILLSSIKVKRFFSTFTRRTTRLDALRKTLAGLGLVVLGVSKDTTKSHKKFAEKYELPFPLLSDVDGVVCEAYGVWRKKKFMGKEYMGIERMSFLIDEQGKIAKVYESVKPKEHTDEVIRDVA
jgi:peroxiredoxin Q/BCP